MDRADTTIFDASADPALLGVVQASTTQARADTHADTHNAASDQVSPGRVGGRAASWDAQATAWAIPAPAATPAQPLHAHGRHPHGPHANGPHTHGSHTHGSHPHGPHPHGSSTQSATAPANAPQALALALEAVCEQLAHGLLLLDAQARVLYANAAARAELLANPWLHIVAGHLQARHGETQAQLQTQLWAASCGQRGVLHLAQGGEGKTKAKSKLAPLSVAITPLHSSDAPLQANGAPAAAQLALIFTRRHLCEPLMLHHFARGHQLTVTEEAVLRWLCQGDDPSSIAQHMGIALSTVRSHMKSIAQKTGCHGMRALQNRLALLPPLAALATVPTPPIACANPRGHVA